MISIDDLLEKLSSDPQTKAIVQALKPYIPVIAREGMQFYEDVIEKAKAGDWQSLNEKTWQLMNENERDSLSNDVLREAQDAVDNAFELEKTAKEVALKVATSLLLSLI